MRVEINEIKVNSKGENLIITDHVMLNHHLSSPTKTDIGQ